MSSTDTGLGNFATLPPELRLCIWDWLFPRHIIGPLKGPPIFKRRRTRLPILRTSKELYAEISHHLYSRISVAIRLNPRKHQWLAFRIQNLGISWLIEEKEDAIQRGFDKFPLQRVPIYIGIHPPNPASPGDLIRLWQNVQSLVNILEHAPSIKSMHVQFLSNMRYRWHEGEQGLKNVTYSSWYNRQFYDHQIIYLQFCRLEKVQSMKVSYPTELDGVLRWTMEDGAGVHLLKQDCENDYHCISGGPHFRISSKFDSLEDFFNKVNRCFRDMLFGDILPGRTARVLHRQIIKEMYQERMNRWERMLLKERIEHWLAGTLKGPEMCGNRIERILGNTDSNEEDWQVHGRDSCSPWCQRIQNCSLFSAFLLLVASLTLFLVTLFSARWSTEGTGNRRVYCV